MSDPLAEFRKPCGHEKYRSLPSQTAEDGVLWRCLDHYDCPGTIPDEEAIAAKMAKDLAYIKAQEARIAELEAEREADKQRKVFSELARYRVALEQLAVKVADTYWLDPACDCGVIARTALEEE
jgi:hypothetical protein